MRCPQHEHLAVCFKVIEAAKLRRCRLINGFEVFSNWARGQQGFIVVCEFVVVLDCEAACVGPCALRHEEQTRCLHNRSPLGSGVWLSVGVSLCFQSLFTSKIQGSCTVWDVLFSVERHFSRSFQASDSFSVKCRVVRVWSHPSWPRLLAWITLRSQRNHRKICSSEFRVPKSISCKLVCLSC